MYKGEQRRQKNVSLNFGTIKKPLLTPDTISDEEAEAFSKEAWSEFVARRNKHASAGKRTALRKYASLVAAAIVFLVVLLNFPLTEKKNRDKEPVTTEVRISRQFTTQDRNEKITLSDGINDFYEPGNYHLHARGEIQCASA